MFFDLTDNCSSEQPSEFRYSIATSLWCALYFGLSIISTIIDLFQMFQMFQIFGMFPCQKIFSFDLRKTTIGQNVLRKSGTGSGAIEKKNKKKFFWIDFFMPTSLADI